jgi:hypothetical protein
MNRWLYRTMGAISLLGFLCIGTAQSQTLVCDKVKSSIEMPREIHTQASQDVLKFCPSLNVESFALAEEVVSFSRYGILGCASDVATLSNIASKRLPISEWYVAKGADQKCLSFLAKQFSINETVTQPIPTKPNQSTQQQSQAQQQAAQAQQRATQNQARADQARQGKRKTHDPAAEASQCLSLSNDGAMFGGFTNSCNYKVEYIFCNYQPKDGSWADSFNCQKKNGIGAWQVGANGKSVDHTNRNGMTYWFACKSPAWPLDAEFTEGQGISARCRNAGGN